MATHTHTRQLQIGSEVVTRNFAIETDGQNNVGPITVPADGTPVEVQWPLDYDALKSLFLDVVGDDVVLETNSSSVPDDTINLKAGKPLEWENDSGYFSNPLSADVTSIFLTNNGSAAATFNGYALPDATP